MPKSAREETTRRLQSAAGHLEGIVRMLNEEHAYCVDVMMQIKAVMAALGKAQDVALRGHLEAHVTTARQRGDTEAIVAELMDLLRMRT